MSNPLQKISKYKYNSFILAHKECVLTHQEQAGKGYFLLENLAYLKGSSGKRDDVIHFWGEMEVVKISSTKCLEPDTK